MSVEQTQEGEGGLRPGVPSLQLRQIRKKSADWFFIQKIPNSWRTDGGQILLSFSQMSLTEIRNREAILV